MLRLYYVVLVSMPLILFYYCVYFYVIRHKEYYSEIQKYRLVQRWVNIIKRNGRIKTDVYGLEKIISFRQKYTVKTSNWIISVMKKQELCYNKTWNNEFLTK